MKIQAIVTSVILFALACPAFANTSSLKSFRADYTVKYDGLPFGKSTTTLMINKKNYQLCINDVTTLPFMSGSQRECSNGLLFKNKVQPDFYSYSYEHNQKHQNISIAFNWQKHVATIQVNHSEWQTPITDGTQDKISYLLELRQNITSQNNFSFPVADGGKVKTYKYKVIGEEKISTPLKRFNTIKVERLPMPGKDNVTVWIAPQMDNMIVRVQQNKHIVDNGIAEITNYYA